MQAAATQEGLCNVILAVRIWFSTALLPFAGFLADFGVLVTARLLGGNDEQDCEPPAIDKPEERTPFC